MSIMNILLWAAIIAVFGALAAALIILFFKEGLVEVSPKRAVAYKNIWTGKAFALLPGMHQIIPGIHKKLVDLITLENEPSDPEIIKVITADGIQISVDAIIYTQQVGGGIEEEGELREAIVNVATVIDYEKRRSFIWDRVKTYIQEAVAGIEMDEIFSKDETNKKIIGKIKRYVNRQLKAKIETEWGIKVEVGIEDIKPPQKLLEVAEEVATAKKEGQKIREKAIEAGVEAELVMIGDIAYDIAIGLGTMFKGGK